MGSVSRDAFIGIFDLSVYKFDIFELVFLTLYSLRKSSLTLRETTYSAISRKETEGKNMQRTQRKRQLFFRTYEKCPYIE